MARPPVASPGRALRDVLASDAVVVAPGCYDALSARLVARAGFRAAYLSGYGVSASLLAVPDVGVVTQTEMVDAVRRAAAAAGGIPLIADADTGYGGGRSPALTLADLAALGFRVVIFPVTALFAATGAVLGRLHQLGADGVPRAEPPVATAIDFGGFGQLLDIDAYLPET